MESRFYLALDVGSGLHAFTYNIRGTTNAGLIILVLPPQMCDGLRDPNVPNQYLSQGVPRKLRVTTAILPSHMVCSQLVRNGILVMGLSWQIWRVLNR